MSIKADYESLHMYDGFKTDHSINSSEYLRFTPTNNDVDSYNRGTIIIDCGVPDACVLLSDS